MKSGKGPTCCTDIKFTLFFFVPINNLFLQIPNQFGVTAFQSLKSYKSERHIKVIHTNHGL